MIEIPLTQGQTAIVDDEDAALARMKWYAEKREQTFYASRNRPKVNGRSVGVVRLHAAILGAPPPGMEIDHINGNGLDNRRENLRVVPHRLNQRNRRANRTKARTGFKGVYWHSAKRYWHAQITVNGRIACLGCFPTAEAGARAYDEAARTHHGAHARLNFPG